MRRIIKFPLIMDNGKEVRTIEELRENFCLKKVTEYFLEGKLKNWVQQRNYIEELSQLEKLECCDNRQGIPLELCKIFDVDHSVEFNISELARKKGRISTLKGFSDDEVWEEKLEFIAFNQEELEAKLLDGILFTILDSKNQIQSREIYLCGEMFTVYDKFKNITYVGVNTPIVNIVSSTVFDAKTNNIKFENIKITSDAILEAVITNMERCIIDNSKVLLRKIWGGKSKIFDGINFNKIFIYKDKLIGSQIQFYSRDAFQVIDINTGKILKNSEDLKACFPSFPGFVNDIGVYAMNIYNDTLICFCVEWSWKNEIIVYIDLETLEIKKFYKVPQGKVSNGYVYHPDEIGVFQDKISIYQLDLISQTDLIRCQYHDYNTGEVLHARNIESLYNLTYSDGTVHHKIYNGNIYIFSPKKKKILSDNQSYNFRGFNKGKNKNNNTFFETVKIGAFDIFQGKIVAAGCYSVSRNNTLRLVSDSVVQDGYIAVYDINGGDVIKSLKVSNSIIRVIKYCEGVLAIISEDGEVKILDSNTFEIVNTFRVCEGGDIAANTPTDIYIDNNSDKMAVLYNRKIYLYE